MTRAEEYRRRALEAEEAARQAKSEPERIAYERIAAAWWQLHGEAARRERRGV